MVQIVRYLLVAAICLILGRATAFGQTDWDAVPACCRNFRS